jgi:hypothetical protein
VALAGGGAGGVIRLHDVDPAHAVLQPNTKQVLARLDGVDHLLGLSWSPGECREGQRQQQRGQ